MIPEPKREKVPADNGYSYTPPGRARAQKKTSARFSPGIDWGGGGFRLISDEVIIAD